MLWLRRLTPLAFVAAVHTAAPAAALAQPRPAPAAPAPASASLLTRAQQQFDRQEYEESIQTLTGALVKPNASKDEKVGAYKLLFFNLVILNRKDEAEQAARALLTLNPDFELPRGESPRFREPFAATKERWVAEGRPGLVRETEPPPAPVTMQHTSPSQAEMGTQVPLSARLEDPQARVAEVRLFYRTGSKGKFVDVAAHVDDSVARAQLPASAVKPPFVEYYFMGFDKQHEPIVSRGDASSPLRIAVPEPSKPGWLLPVAIGGGIIVAAGLVVGGLALAGVFKSSTPGTNNPGNGGRSAVLITFGE